MKRRKLESIHFQEELIKDEREDMEESLEVLKTKELEEEAEEALSKLSASIELTETSGIPTSTSDSAAKAARAKEELVVDHASTPKTSSSPTDAEADVEVIENRTLAPGHRGVDEDEEAVTEEPKKERVHVAVVASILEATVPTSTSEPAKTSKVAVEEFEHEDEEVPDLTVYELQAIGDLARSSSVQREKEALTQLQSQLEDLHARQTKASNPDNTGEGKPAPVREEDRSIENMMQVLSRMNRQLETKINTTEISLGGKLRVLDMDEDGSMSVEELKEGVIKTFKQSEISEEDIDELIEALDKDKDGKVSVPELIKYVEELKEKKEAELLEAMHEKSK